MTTNHSTTTSIWIQMARFLPPNRTFQGIPLTSRVWSPLCRWPCRVEGWQVHFSCLLPPDWHQRLLFLRQPTPLGTGHAWRNAHWCASWQQRRPALACKRWMYSHIHSATVFKMLPLGWTDSWTMKWIFTLRHVIPFFFVMCNNVQLYAYLFEILLWPWPWTHLIQRPCYQQGSER